MKNTNVKIKLIVLFLVAVAFLLILSNKAFATEGLVTDGNVTESSLDSIPSTIALDIQEVEYEKASEIAYTQIASLLKEQGIIVDNGSDSVEEDNGIVLSVNATYDGINDFIPRYIEISLEDIGTNNTVASKTIGFTYNNSSKYNETDKKYVEDLIKNIDLPSNSYELPSIDIIASYLWNCYYELGSTEPLPDVEDLFSNVDSSIKLDLYGASGDGVPFRTYFDGIWRVFKDGIYYGNVHFARYNIAEVTIPENIEDTEAAYAEYARPKVQQYVDNTFGTGERQVVSITKKYGYYYDVTIDGESEDIIGNFGYLIIKKADGAPAGNDIYVDNLTENINIAAKPISNSTVMISKANDKGYNTILGSYELTLTGAENLSEPIDITFTVGDKYNNQTVYILHQKKDGSFEDFTKTVVNGKVTITVDELSPFTLAVKTSTTDNEDTNPSEPTEKPQEPTIGDKGELDETPKTGTNFNMINILSLAAILSLGGIMITKRFNK